MQFKGLGITKTVRYLAGQEKLLEEIILSHLGLKSDFVGYESLIHYLANNGINLVEGDFLEIGAFMGGGTKKLAEYATSLGKQVYVIDIFDIEVDSTANDRGQQMRWIYRKILGKNDLKQIFYNNIAKATNVHVIECDSKKVELPKDVKLCFSFLDGNHDPSYVKSDFQLAWKKTQSDGIVAFHDYRGDLPQVTSAIDDILARYRNDIKLVNHIEKKDIILIHKNSSSKS